MNIKLLKGKDFGLLMIGKLVSLIGTQMQNFALSLYVFQITGSAKKFASILIAGLIPELIFGPIFGVFADWLDRKKIIVCLDMVRGIVIGIYAYVFIVNDGLPLASIYVLVIVLSLISVLFQPAVTTIIPSIVKKEELVDANAVNSFIMTAGNIVAPLLAGFLFGVYGLFIILVFNAFSFVISSISEIFINIPKTNKKPEKINISTFVKDFVEGLKFIVNKKIIFSIIIIALVVNFACTAFVSIGMVFICKKILKVSDFQYGILEFIIGAAMIFAPVLCSIVAKKIKLNKLVFWGIFLISIIIGIIALVVSPIYLNLFNGNMVPYITLLALMFIMALISAVLNMTIGIMCQQEVTLSIMGRVSTVMSTVCMAAIPLGQFIFGILYDSIDAWICVVITAVIPFITILLLRKFLCNNEKIKNKDNNEKLVCN